MAGDTVFEKVGQTYQPMPLATGPWSPDALHGGAPAALLAHAIERVDLGGRYLPARLTFEFWRPVPVKPLSVAVEILRDGRKVKAAQATLSADEQVVGRCYALMMRDDPTGSPPVEQPHDPPGSTPDDGTPKDPRQYQDRPTFASAYDMRFVTGGFHEPGPSRTWFKLEKPMIAGEPNTPLMQAVAASDYANGISSLVPMKEYLFMNADLIVRLQRQPTTDWIMLDAKTEIGPHGNGYAVADLYDLHGRFGHAVQTLLFEKISPAA